MMHFCCGHVFIFILFNQNNLVCIHHFYCSYIPQSVHHFSMYRTFINKKINIKKQWGKMNNQPTTSKACTHLQFLT